MNDFGIGSDGYAVDYNDFEQSYSNFGDNYDCFYNNYRDFDENHLSFDSTCSSFSETYGFSDNYLNYTPSYEHLEINLYDFQSFCRDTYGSFGDASNPLGDADLLSDFDYDLYRSYNEAATCFNNYDGIETVDLSSFGLGEDASHCSAEHSAFNSPPEMNINTDAVFDPMPLNSYAANSSCGIINDLDMQSYSLISEQNYFNTPYYCNITVSDLFSFGSTAHEQGPDTEISNSQDLTSYEYVQNNPVNFIDPGGIEGWNMITSFQYLHNQGIAHLQPGYKPPPQGEPTKLPAAVSDLGKMVVDQAGQMAAEKLASKYIGPVAGSALKKANFLLGIFDPFPPPAGGPGDMILEPMMPTSPPDLPWEDNSPCK